MRRGKLFDVWDEGVAVMGREKWFRVEGEGAAELICVGTGVGFRALRQRLRAGAKKKPDSRWYRRARIVRVSCPKQTGICPNDIFII